MQLTRLDRWLQEEFVHETHVYTLSPPPSLPRGVREVPVPQVEGRRYNHHLVASNPRAALSLATLLKENGQMFSSTVVNRPAWYVPFIAPVGKSVTWRCVWIVFSCISVFALTIYVHRFWSDESFRANFIEAIKTLRG